MVEENRQLKAAQLDQSIASPELEEELVVTLTSGVMYHVGDLDADERLQAILPNKSDQMGVDWKPQDYPADQLLSQTSHYHSETSYFEDRADDTVRHKVDVYPYDDNHQVLVHHHVYDKPKDQYNIQVFTMSRRSGKAFAPEVLEQVTRDVVSGEDVLTNPDYYHTTLSTYQLKQASQVSSLQRQEDLAMIAEESTYGYADELTKYKLGEATQHEGYFVDYYDLHPDRDHVVTPQPAVYTAEEVDYRVELDDEIDFEL